MSLLIYAILVSYDIIVAGGGILDLNVNLSNNLKRLMKERELTKVQLWRDSGVNRVIITKILKGETNTTLQTVNRLAKGLNVNPLELLFVCKEVDND